MAIDLLNLQPHKISRDLSGYTVFFYGDPKAGKTTIASQFEDALLLAFEIGYLAIPGVKALPISTWSEFKQALQQLKKPEVKAMYKNIIIDTADICYDLAEKYVCSNNDVDSVGDMAYGKGYGLVAKAFDEALRSIPQMGYGLILISHATDKTFKDENGSEYNQIVPTLSNKGRLIAERMSDIIGYAHPVQQEDGSTKTILYMRGTPRYVAGSRFRYTPNAIEFSYENLVAAIHDAIETEAKMNKGKFIETERTKAYDSGEKLDFEALMAEFASITKKIQGAVEKAEFASYWGPAIQGIIEEHLGKGKKIKDISANQVEQLDIIVYSLKNLIEDKKLAL